MSNELTGLPPWPVIAGALGNVDAPSDAVFSAQEVTEAISEINAIWRFQDFEPVSTHSFKRSPVSSQSNRGELEMWVLGGRSVSDKAETKDDTQSMDYVDKDVLNAKLEAIEARMDGRVASIEGKIDAFLTGQVERDRASETVSKERNARLENDIASIKAEAKAVNEDVSNIRITMAKYLGASIVIGAVAAAAMGGVIRYFLT